MDYKTELLKKYIEDCVECANKNNEIYPKNKILKKEICEVLYEELSKNIELYRKFSSEKMNSFTFDNPVFKSKDVFKKYLYITKNIPPIEENELLRLKREPLLFEMDKNTSAKAVEFVINNPYESDNIFALIQNLPISKEDLNVIFATRGRALKDYMNIVLDNHESTLLGRNAFLKEKPLDTQPPIIPYNYLNIIKDKELMETLNPYLLIFTDGTDKDIKEVIETHKDDDEALAYLLSSVWLSKKDKKLIEEYDVDYSRVLSPDENMVMPIFDSYMDACIALLKKSNKPFDVLNTFSQKTMVLFNNVNLTSSQVWEITDKLAMILDSVKSHKDFCHKSSDGKLTGCFKFIDCLNSLIQRPTLTPETADKIYDLVRNNVEFNFEMGFYTEVKLLCTLARSMYPFGLRLMFEDFASQYASLKKEPKNTVEDKMEIIKSILSETIDNMPANTINNDFVQKVFYTKIESAINKILCHANNKITANTFLKRLPEDMCTYKMKAFLTAREIILKNVKTTTKPIPSQKDISKILEFIYKYFYNKNTKDKPIFECPMVIGIDKHNSLDENYSFYRIPIQFKIPVIPKSSDMTKFEDIFGLNSELAKKFPELSENIMETLTENKDIAEEIQQSWFLSFNKNFKDESYLPFMKDGNAELLFRPHEFMKNKILDKDNSYIDNTTKIIDRLGRDVAIALDRELLSVGCKKMDCIYHKLSYGRGAANEPYKFFIASIENYMRFHDEFKALYTKEIKKENTRTDNRNVEDNITL